MNTRYLLALTTTLVLVPTVVVAQDEALDDEADWTTTYHCVEVVADIESDPETEILEGNFELVDNTMCTAAPADTASADFETLLFKGKGETKTRPFSLPDGDYEFVVKFKGKDCYDSGEIGLNSIEEGYEIEEFATNDYAYGIEAGRYFLEGNYIGKKCTWNVRIAAFEE